MSRLTWSAIGERYFETGIDRGVLYVDGQGVAWTGLISVSESPSGGDARPFYIDGVKFLNIASAEEYEATIKAFGCPPEFGPCDGTTSVRNGLFVTQQPRKPFGFSYRTKLGNDVDGSDHAYKIHIVYNALAAPSQRDNNSIGDSVDPIASSWSITTLAPAITGYKSTAHFVIDSSKTPKGLLSSIEDILYGSDSAAPRLLTAQELVDMFNSEGPILRRNLAIDPRATSYGVDINTMSWRSSRWFGNNSQTGSHSLITGAVDGPIGITTYARKTWTTPIVTTTYTDTGFDTGRMDVVSGETVAVSGMLRPSLDQIGRITFYWYDSTGTQILRFNDDVDRISLPANTWTTVSGIAVAPANAVKVNVAIDIYGGTGGTLWTDGSTLDATALLVELSDSVSSYFDGSTPDIDGVFYDWEGTPNDSTSVIRSWN